MIEIPKIVLTVDRALFTDYGGVDALGFGLCLPVRLIPSLVEYRILAPPAPIKNGRAVYSPYGLGKVEAALIASGFSREEVVIVPPEKLEDIVDKDTEVVGVHVVDPRGLAPVSWTLRVMTGGGETCTAYEFRRLMDKISKLKKKYKFTVIIGGPGVWQLRGKHDEYGFDVLYEGEAEIDFPILVRKILNGDKIPNYIVARLAPPDKIPPILTSSRSGQVQITRGCPRGCQFCKPTTFIFRSIPIDTILEEAKINAKIGVKEISFVTEDVLLYGAKGLQLNEEAVVGLFEKTSRRVKKYGIERLAFSHVTLSSALVLKNAVKRITDINNLSEDNPFFPQVGFESGSPRIVDRYFRGKPYPWKPKDWPWILVEGSKLLNDYYWYPCLTYIVGFPDATPDDYIKTIEVIDRLREEGFKGWIFPLLLIPIGGTRIEGRSDFSTLNQLPQEAIDSIVAGWEHSMEFSKSIYPAVFRNIKNPFINGIVGMLVEKAIETLKSWIDTIKRDPEYISREYSKYNLRNTRSVLTMAMKSLSPNITRRHRKLEQLT